jgi:hypothetical protein
MGMMGGWMDGSVGITGSRKERFNRTYGMIA